jgi:hypothetical protein
VGFLSALPAAGAKSWAGKGCGVNGDQGIVRPSPALSANSCDMHKIPDDQADDYADPEAARHSGYLCIYSFNK